MFLLAHAGAHAQPEWIRVWEFVVVFFVFGGEH